MILGLCLVPKRSGWRRRAAARVASRSAGDSGGVAVVDIGGGVQPDAGVAVVVVVAVDESVHELLRVDPGAESFGELGAYFKVLNQASE